MLSKFKFIRRGKRDNDISINFNGLSGSLILFALL